MSEPTVVEIQKPNEEIPRRKAPLYDANMQEVRGPTFVPTAPSRRMDSKYTATPIDVRKSKDTEVDEVTEAFAKSPMTGVPPPPPITKPSVPLIIISPPAIIHSSKNPPVRGNLDAIKKATKYFDRIDTSDLHYGGAKDSQTFYATAKAIYKLFQKEDDGSGAKELYKFRFKKQEDWIESYNMGLNKRVLGHLRECGEVIEGIGKQDEDKKIWNREQAAVVYRFKKKFFPLKEDSYYKKLWSVVTTASLPKHISAQQIKVLLAEKFGKHEVGTESTKGGTKSIREQLETLTTKLCVLPEEEFVKFLDQSAILKQRESGLWKEKTTIHPRLQTIFAAHDASAGARAKGVRKA